LTGKNGGDIITVKEAEATRDSGALAAPGILERSGIMANR
jgi:hypothetical protein